MRWPTLMNILKHPARAIGRLMFAKCRTDRQASRDPSQVLVKEACVAGSQFANELMHQTLEFFCIFALKNDILSCLREAQPVPPIELRVEVVLLDSPVSPVES